MSGLTSAIYGCEGLTLTNWEKGFFREQQPFGFIVFGRNIDSAEQLRRLTDEMREASGDPLAPVFVDQEGGTVARLKGPNFRHPPSPHRFAEMAREDPETASEAVWLNARLMAMELKEVGINANCVPTLDVVGADGHPFLQKRALGDDPELVTLLGRSIAVGMREGGVAPCIKHAPGHGRGNADSHHNLPEVTAAREELEERDFLPFKRMLKEPMLMSAHVLYHALDKDNPGTLSETIIKGLIRDEWGYDGLILTDDINMNALGGTIEERSRRALAAGCEIICHCNGVKEDMQQVARAAQTLSRETMARADRVRTIANARPKELEVQETKERLASLDLLEQTA
ncbi:beta-N-acetylhexosaminidase [Parvularcula maris]|uniref:beta-N-acetylhexosaminidase n=1 Tax=Parvularcula maris TaxID=2965077 RepID=A0A9X2RKP1_9PROT|nr:beta-N-acetylhexosaminidase [Parvularcula maris]MCQ8185988.1 beta-N-acetylhexosaminidase [Parvularcula maris]